jgi:PadR family transcriptional regulator AphA
MEYRPSRGFPVEYAALGLLIETPRHGYELHRDLSEGLGSLWRVASSQLYSVLHRLVEEGWAAVEVEPQEDRPSRHTYTATEAGRRAFWQWAGSPVMHPRDLRVVFLAKIYFLRKLRPEAIGRLIDAQRSVLAEALASVTERGAIASDDVAVGTAACSFRAAQMESALRWLEESRTLLESQREET